ncbi:replication protein A 32 kDa subunit A-like isoform X2 [Silene latifolia]|uniref:replication protein A 32 kDa subunit A-like isoform X2 n=1 Tax=Silene latifolia TaxID=37657 RepID=UPI003D7889F3
MYSSQYDVGFTSTQLSQPDTAAVSPAKSRDAQGIVPVTVKQISQASPSSTDDKSSFLIDGAPITNVKLVGIVADMMEKVTDVSFVLDDGTGRIGCKRWLNEAFDRKQMEAIENGMYVLLVGHLKNVKGNTEVVAFNVRPVTNFDEVTFHHVECIHQHMLNKKSQKGDSVTQSQISDSSQSTPIKTESNGFHSSPANQFSVQMSVDGLKDIDQRVIEYLRQSSSVAQERGVHRDDIARHLKLPVEKIMQSITCLEEEGLLYSTIDEFHFKTTTTD